MSIKEVIARKLLGKDGRSQSKTEEEAVRPSESDEDVSISEQSGSYWTSHNVTLHHQFSSTEDSLEYFHWRNDQYFDYIDLMPVSGQDGKTVLDYGCGPGHDLVGFSYYSKPAKLLGMDVSESSLAEANARLTMHRANVQLHCLEPGVARLPVEDESVDYIHSSGVLHHIEDPGPVLKEFNRILSRDGKARIMVYNRESIWYHLYVAYQLRILENIDSDIDLDEAFARSTDGPDCPISRCYLPQQFVDLCAKNGFVCKYLGAAVSAIEAQVFQNYRYNAIQNRSLPTQSREFLTALQVDNRNLPVYNGTLAGIDACFELTKE